MRVRPRTICIVAALALVVAPMALGQAMATEPTSIDEGGAEAFVRSATWTNRGTAIDTPSFLAHPLESFRTIEAMEVLGVDDRVDVTAAAHAAVSVQTPSGGFDAFGGDFLGPWTDQTAAGILLAAAEDVPFDEDGAEAFLRSMQNEDGGFASRKSVTGGNLGSHREATYYATIGLDALGALDAETEQEIIDFLHETQNADGGWSYQPAEPMSITSATYFAVRTLDHLDALDSPTAREVAVFLHTVEDPSGGFMPRNPAQRCLLCVGVPFIVSIPEPATTPATGRALIMLDILGEHAVGFDATAHAQWFAQSQIDEGRDAGAFPLFGHKTHTARETVQSLDESSVGSQFPDLAPYEVPVTNHARNTALALQSLAAHGQVDAIDVESATSYLDRSQHDNGGFGWWPGSKESLGATSAAHRALEILDVEDEHLADELASSLSSWQEPNGVIQPPRWDYRPEPDHTAYAVDALAHADRLGAIDQGSAASYLASTQKEDGSFETPSDVERMTMPRTAWIVVHALEHLDSVSRLDVEAAGAALADLQGDEGQITEERVTMNRAVWDTARALLALEALGQLDAVDVDAAVEFLASTQASDGSFPRGEHAAYTVLALDAVGHLDAIDTDAAQAYLEDQQREHGGFAPDLLPFLPEDGVMPMHRHADALEALDILSSR